MGPAARRRLALHSQNQRHGVGITGEQISKIFEAFTRLDQHLSRELRFVASHFMGIAAFGALGVLGLLFGMKSAAEEPRRESGSAALHELRAIAQPKLLVGALVTVLAPVLTRKLLSDSMIS